MDLFHSNLKSTIRRNLKVYFRKRGKSLEQLEHITYINEGQELESIPPALEIFTCTDSYNDEFISPIIDDSDFLIVLRKGV